MAVEDTIICHKDLSRVVSMWGEEARILSRTSDWMCITVGRATAIVFQNPNIDPNIILFGYVKILENDDSVQVLFKGIELWAEKKGAQSIIGPVNYATWMNNSWMTEGWDLPEVAPEANNPKYLPEAINKLGYSVYHTYSSVLTAVKDSKLPVYEYRYEQLVDQGYRFETYVSDDILFARDDIFNLVNSISAKPLYSIMPYDIFGNYYFKDITSEGTHIDLCIKSGNLCGYSINYVNSHHKDWWVYKSVSVNQSEKNNNIASAFQYMTHKHAMENGCSGVVHHYRYDSGKISGKAAGSEKIIKRYALFGKELKIK